GGPERAKRPGEVPVARGINAVRGGVVPAGDMLARAHARRPARRIEPGHQRFRLTVECGLHEARVDATALAGALAAHQRGKDSHREQRRSWWSTADTPTGRGPLTCCPVIAITPNSACA